MTRRRWIADEVNGDIAALTGSNANHLARVLRAIPGQQFDISTGVCVRSGVVTSVSDERIEFRLGEELAASCDIPVSLLLAVIKFDRFEWAVEKCTELGVDSIVPIVTRRTEPHLVQAAQKRVERWRRIAHEAAQQSRRLSPPEIPAPLKLRDAAGRPAGLRIVLDENERQRVLVDLVERTETPESVGIAIGPEGGWTSDEIAALASAGWCPASLGPAILRAETAAVAAVAVTRTLLL